MPLPHEIPEWACVSSEKPSCHSDNLSSYVIEEHFYNSANIFFLHRYALLSCIFQIVQTIQRVLTQEAGMGYLLGKQHGSGVCVWWEVFSPEFFAHQEDRRHWGRIWWVKKSVCMTRVRHILPRHSLLPLKEQTTLPHCSKFKFCSIVYFLQLSCCIS